MDVDRKNKARRGVRNVAVAQWEGGVVLSLEFAQPVAVTEHTDVTLLPAIMFTLAVSQQRCLTGKVKTVRL